MKVGCSWSGGKDSSLALHRAIKLGLDVSILMNFVSESTGRCCFHGVPIDIVKDQGKSMSIQLMQKNMPEDMKDYEAKFREALRELKVKGCEGVVFGDIYLDEHKDWVERVCKLEGMQAFLPLWGSDPEDLLREMDETGIKAIVVSCLEKLESDFVGSGLTSDHAPWLKSQGACPCGEHGEYHTLVVDSPIFSKKIKVTESEKILVNGFWTHWHLDIGNWLMETKNPGL